MPAPARCVLLLSNLLSIAVNRQVPLPGYAGLDRISGVPARTSTLRARSQGRVERGVCARFAEPTRQSVESVSNPVKLPREACRLKGFLRSDSTIRSGAQTLWGCSTASRFRRDALQVAFNWYTDWLGGQSCGPAQLRDPRQPPAPSEQRLAAVPALATDTRFRPDHSMHSRTRSLHPNVDAHCSLRCSRLKGAPIKEEPRGPSGDVPSTRPLWPCGRPIDTE